jgi:hypothetical protein
MRHSNAPSYVLIISAILWSRSDMTLVRAILAISRSLKMPCNLHAASGL